MQIVFGNTRWFSMRVLDNVLSDRHGDRERYKHNSRVQGTRTMVLKHRYPRSFQSKVRRMRVLRAIGTMLPVAVRVVVRRFIAIVTRGMALEIWANPRHAQR
jgi:hypothetical protein